MSKSGVRNWDLGVSKSEKRKGKQQINTDGQDIQDKSGKAYWDRAPEGCWDRVGIFHKKMKIVARAGAVILFSK